MQSYQTHIASFYHLAQSPDEKLCQGTACFVARHLNPQRWAAAAAQSPRLYCLGKCYMAPASGSEEKRPAIEVRASEGIVLSRIVNGGARSLPAYVRQGGYEALAKALKKSPQGIIDAVETSGLRGRGGAGFSTGRKWCTVFEQQSPEKFVVANADEGDPGAYIDRFLMEDDPHRLIEAMIIAGYAVGAGKGYIYLRNEYPAALSSLQRALVEARGAGFLGEKILQSRVSFDIEIVLGRGSYVCGEETALIRSIEGKRPEVMPRPPYPTEQGLFARPTLVNNVETLASIPWIVENGGEAYRALGFSKSRGTKMVSLNSLFNRPGLYEIEFGISIRKIIKDLGGGLKTGQIKGVIIGGPLAGIVPPQEFDRRFGFEELRAIGCSVGHGGIVAFDEHTSIQDLIHHVFSFGAYESCGKCTPCRLGSRRVEQIFAPFLRGAAGSKERTEYSEILSALATTSLCGLGGGLAEFGESAVRYYGKELDACFR
jgi:NADH:ubiquinone oxidoreductase subunit F (NADH-binding)